MADKVKVLFIDDEKFVINTIKRELADEPFELLIADNSKEALELLMRNEVAIIAADLMMPIVGGQELLTIVKNDFPETIRVLFSGAADRPVLQKTIKEDLATAYFIKPFKWAEEVKPKLREFLGFYELKTESRSLRKTLQTVLEISKDGFLLFDDMGAIPYMNPAARVLLDQKKEEVTLQLTPLLEDKNLKQLEMIGKDEKIIVLEELSAAVDWGGTQVRLAILIPK